MVDYSLPLPGQLTGKSKIARQRLGDALPRFRWRGREGVEEEYVWGFPLKNEPAVLVVGEDYFTFLSTQGFDQLFRPSNREGRLAYEKHLKKQGLDKWLGLDWKKSKG